MASFSRSGETLLLRCLNAHPDIHVVFQIRATDKPEDFALFRHLQTWPKKSITLSHPAVAATTAKEGQVLLVKNAVWEHGHPWNGFVLVRNSLSVFRSIHIHGARPEGFEIHKKQFVQWARGIDRNLVEAMHDEDHLACFCMLYNRKMYPLSTMGLPIVHYELFVQYPEATLRWLLKQLRIRWSDAVLRSHELYKEGEIGHGRIRLWEPINQKAMARYKDLPQAVLDKVYGLTYPTLTAFGYYLDDQKDIRIKP